jgi:putative hydroxymethylpyrimidine transport system substrate-binding protein
MLKAALHGAHVNRARVHEVNVGFSLVPAMLSGKVDATLGAYWNYEAIQLALQHRQPTVIPINHAGVPTYNELVLVVREKDARTRGQDLRAFMQALSRGEREVRANPRSRRQAGRQGQSVARPQTAAGIDQAHAAGGDACEPAPPLRLAGPLGVGGVRGLDVLHGLIKHAPGAGLPPFTNEYLPGQGI